MPATAMVSPNRLTRPSRDRTVSTGFGRGVRVGAGRSDVDRAVGVRGVWVRGVWVRAVVDRGAVDRGAVDRSVVDRAGTLRAGVAASVAARDAAGLAAVVRFAGVRGAGAWSGEESTSQPYQAELAVPAQYHETTTTRGAEYVRGERADSLGKQTQWCVQR